jgi:hypothetical protein
MSTPPANSCNFHCSQLSYPASGPVGMERTRYGAIFIAIACAIVCALVEMSAQAQVNGIGQKPYLGWSTYSEQTIVPSSSVMN